MTIDHEPTRRVVEGERPEDPLEPRARDVVLAEAAPSFDPARRWEAVRVEEPALPLFVRAAMPMRLDPAAWKTGFLAVHERELPPELFADLRELAPQALLRDLHRPVREFEAVPEEIEGTQLVGRWKMGVEEARQARRRNPLPSIEPSVRDVAARQAWRRRFLAEPWQPVFDDEAPRRPIRFYPEG